MAFTMEDIKVLRERTGAGMMDCKNALQENDGDMEKAVTYLREKGIAKAAKKAGRIAAEGLVESYIHMGGRVGVLLEVNCETDFVSRGDKFKDLVHDIALHIAAANPSYVTKEEVPADVIEKEKEILRAQAIEEGKPAQIVEKMVEGRIKTFYNDNCLLCQKFVKDPDKTIEQIVTEATATIGEKISVRRFVRYEGAVASYVHNGKIGVLLNADNKDEELLNDICLHIASSAPKFVSRNEIPQEVIEEETRIEMGKEDLQNKPEAIRGKIVEGRVNKLMAERCLLEQPFVKDPNVTVGQLIEGKLTIKAFTRYELGEGLEKRQDNFAEEVMSQING